MRAGSGIAATRSISLLAIVGLLGCVATACGNTVEETTNATERPPPGFWGPGSNVADVDPTLGAVLDVPGGEVRVGYWKYQPVDRSLVAARCNERPLPTVGMRVSPYRLMRVEVSNRVYAQCVATGRCRPPDADLSLDPFAGGSWDDPRRADRPVATSQIAAREFCRAYGGDVPTWYQWVRAAEGDSGAFGIRSLTDTWLRCQLGESLPLCEQLRAAAWSLSARDQRPDLPAYRPLLDPSASPWDVGPYGHVGLFGGAGEWIRVDNSRRGPATDCSAEGQSSDAYVDASYTSGADEPVAVMQVGRDLALMGSLTEPDAIGEVAHGQDAEPAGKGAYFTGIRCAFPAREP